LLLISPLNALAASLSEYREKVRTAASRADDLYFVDKGDTGIVVAPSGFERETIAKLRKTLPVSERVEWQGTSIETNNQWLQDRLDEYEKEKDAAKRATIISGVRERLWSIELKLNELENPSVSNRTKDEDKQKLGEILNREEYQKPEQKEKSVLQRLVEKILSWFRRESPDPTVTPTVGSPLLSFVLQMLLFALIFGVIGFVIYRFAPFFAARFRKREKREKKDRVILGERIAADESSENLFSEAERLAREGNLRGAIRKGYVALLCELSDRKIIGLSRHKTNRDYLRDVRKRHELFENMSGLTVNFERHWYGFDEAEEKDWEEFRTGYRRAVSSGQ
jgi:hypothetical protein